MAMNKEQLELRMADLRLELILAKAKLRDARKYVELLEAKYNEACGLLHKMEKP